MKNFKEILTESVVNEGVHEFTKLVNDKLKEIGLSKLGKVTDNDVLTGMNMKTWKKVNIEPKTLGLAQPMFTKLSLEIAIGSNDNIILLSLNYKYEHIDARNGLKVEYRYNKERGKWFASN